MTVKTYLKDLLRFSLRDKKKIEYNDILFLLLFTVAINLLPLALTDEGKHIISLMLK